MISLIFWFAQLICRLAAVPSIEYHPTLFHRRQYIAVHVHPSTNDPSWSTWWQNDEKETQKKRHDRTAQRIAHDFPSLHLEGHIPIGDGHYLFSHDLTDQMNAELILQRLKEHDGIQWADIQVPKRRLRKRLDPESFQGALKQLQVQDPDILRQWHLVRFHRCPWISLNFVLE